MLAVLSVLSVVAPLGAAYASSVRPRDLSVEANAGSHVSHDRGAVVFVGSARPRFGWALEGDPAAPESKGQSRGQLRQTAFRINATVILPSPTNLASSDHDDDDRRPAWDSGWVVSSSSVGVPWGGANLTAGTRVRWSLRVKDGAGAEGSVVDGPRFHVSPLLAEDWHAEWIVASNMVPRNACAFYRPSPPPLMRAEFGLPAPSASGGGVARAVLHVVGLGWSQVFLNGQRVGQRELDPALTTYNRTVLFSSYDVTGLLRAGGDNAVGVAVGNGWFNQLPFNMFGAFRLRDAMTVGPPRARLQLTVSLMNGTEVTVATGPHWRCATAGPRTHNNLYFGEAYDAREEAGIAGWDAPGFREGPDWRGCLLADDAVVSVENSSGWSPPTPRLQFAPPVRITARWHPVAAWPLEGGGFVLDFGRELVGFLELSVGDGRSGDAIEVLFAERLAVHDGAQLRGGDVDASSTFGPGSVGNWCAPGSGCESMWGECVFDYPPAGRVNGAQTIAYVMKDGPQTYRDAFSFHAFRYVRVGGYPLPYGQPIPLHNFTALRLHTDNRPAEEAAYDGRPEAPSSVLDGPPTDVQEPASFQSSSGLLNEIDQLADVAFRSNWIGIQSDCPGRERLGYGGDMMTSAEAGVYMFASTSFYAKRALDYADARRANGALPETAPFVGIDSCLTNPEIGGIASMPWGAALPYTLHLLHLHAEDNRTIAEHFPVAVGWVALLEAARRPDGTLHNGLGMPGACNGTGEALMGTAFLFQQAVLMAELSRALGQPDALAARYDALATTTHAAFNAVFYNRSAGAYWDGVGTVDHNAQIYALGLGLVPAGDQPRVLRALLLDVAAQNGSFVVDPFAVWLAHCLVELGGGEELMDWMLDTRFPS